MLRVRKNGLHLWQFDSLADQSGIDHYVSDRYSLSEREEFSLSLSSSEDKSLIKTNRSELARALDINVHQLHFPSQVHSTRIVRVTPHTEPVDLLETDALISNAEGHCLSVMSADCVPVLLYDATNRAIAAVHSGWRGTVSRIVERTLDEMAKQFGSTPGNLLAAIGPSISQDAYEVGEEVISSVRSTLKEPDQLLRVTNGGRACLDLWLANKMMMMEWGIPEKQIEVAGLCTFNNNEHFFSARKGDRGRFAAGIMLTSQTEKRR